MPNKSRTPPPPRRAGQAPKTVSDATERRSRMLLYGLAASGLLALILVVLLFTAFGGGSKSDVKGASKTIEAAGCRFKTYKELPRTPHYASLNPSPPPKWNSFPPTSGRHYTTPLVFDQYSEPIAEIQAVHNLEHGAVIVQYGNKTPADTVQKLTDWYRKDPNGVVVAPLPKLGNKIALTAWTRWAECTKFDQKAFDAFRKAFRYHAPEHFPPSYLEPGQ